MIWLSLFRRQRAESKHLLLFPGLKVKTEQPSEIIWDSFNACGVHHRPTPLSTIKLRRFKVALGQAFILGTIIGGCRRWIYPPLVDKEGNSREVGLSQCSLQQHAASLSAHVPILKHDITFYLQTPLHHRIPA